MIMDIKIGHQYYHKYLGTVSIVELLDDRFRAKTPKHGVLDFQYFDFGKVIFINKSHLSIQFTSTEEYEKYLQNTESKQDDSFVEGAKEISTSLDCSNVENSSTPNKVILSENDDTKERTVQEYSIDNTPSITEIKDKKNDFLDYLAQHFSFDGFHHFTDFSNIGSIFQDGKLFCREKALSKKFCDAADHEVLLRTDSAIKKCVRFYYAPKTPTFYSNEGIKASNQYPHMPIPVLFLFSPDIIHKAGSAFLSGGGGNPNSRFTTDIFEAYKFDWKVIFSRCPIPKYDNNIVSVYGDSDRRSIINKRNAEFLVYEEISLRYLKKIIFRSPADVKRAIQLFGENSKYEIDENRKKFEYTNNFLYDYDIYEKDSNMIIALTFLKEDFEKYTHELKISYLNGYVEKIVINSFESCRIIAMDKPIDHQEYNFYFKLLPNNDERISNLVYYMNGHESAIWERTNDKILQGNSF